MKLILECLHFVRMAATQFLAELARACAWLNWQSTALGNKKVETFLNKITQPFIQMS